MVAADEIGVALSERTAVRIRSQTQYFQRLAIAVAEDAAILDADSVWNRSDDRRCAESARTWSIYCAVQKATIEVAGAFHHRRPAAELVRQIVEERTKDRSYEHRLMDYNNDPSTTVSDVRTLFAEALARIP